MKPRNPRFTSDPRGPFRYQDETRQLTYRSAGAVLGTGSTCAPSEVERHY
jgi:hypothetical protein